MKLAPLALALALLAGAPLVHGDPRPTRGLAWEQVGYPWAADRIAVCDVQGAPPADYLPETVWALNYDDTLWYNDAGGADAGWHYVGTYPGLQDVHCGAEYTVSGPTSYTRYLVHGTWLEGTTKVLRRLQYASDPVCVPGNPCPHYGWAYVRDLEPSTVKVNVDHWREPLPAGHDLLSAIRSSDSLVKSAFATSSGWTSQYTYYDWYNPTAGSLASLAGTFALASARQSAYDNRVRFQYACAAPEACAPDFVAYSPVQSGAAPADVISLGAAQHTGVVYALDADYHLYRATIAYYP